jgi:hypothetical protein
METVTPKKSLRAWFEYMLLKLKATAYSFFNLKDLIQVMRLARKHEGIQLEPAELIKIFNAMAEFRHCNMLVFGLGYDSQFWNEANQNGRTVFLEDFQPWYDKIITRYPDLEAYPVSYPCNITQWQELMEQPERLAIDLPVEVSDRLWDVILVDGPRGHKYSEEIPGRMSSIYMASQLVGQKGYVFVHDAQRTVEKAYAHQYLGDKHFIEKVRGRALMLIYRF